MALAVIRDPVTGVNFTAVPGARAYFLTETGDASFTFQFAPPVIEYSTLEQDWVEVSRVGLAPLLVRKADKLEVIKFTIQIASKTDFLEEQNGYIDTLRAIAKSTQRVMFRYSDHEAGLWRITALTVHSAIRHPTSNRIIQGSADITLTRASDPALGVGPVSTPVNPQPAPATSASTAPVTRYTVVQGDTLWGIANKVYGRGDKWQIIYDANRDKIQDPGVVQPGWVLTIPPA